MKIIFPGICLLFMLSSCKESTHSAGPTIPASAHVEVKAFRNSLGWGYELYVNGVKSIYQPLIPGVQGLQGFRSEKDARKVGELVADKLTHQQMPNVSIAELDSLKIVYKKAEEIIPGKKK